MDAYKRKVLGEELEQCAEEFNSEAKGILESDGVKLGSGDYREEMARQVFYALIGFKKAIMKALE